MAQSARSASVYFGKNVNRTRRRGMIRGAVRVIVLLVIVGIVLTPFYISLLYSIKSHSDISLNRLAWPGGACAAHKLFPRYSGKQVCGNRL